VEAKTKRSRGRPRIFDKGKALEAAMVLFWRQGYEGTSMAQLTRAMRVTAPSLYAAFGSKEQLYGDVLDLYVSTHAGFISRALAAPGPIRGVMEHLLLEAATQFSRSEWPPGCLAASGTLRCAQAHRVVARATAGLRRRAQDAIHVRISIAVGQHELASDTDAAGLAAFYATVLQGMSVQAVDGATHEQLIKIGVLAVAAWPQNVAR